MIGLVLAAALLYLILRPVSVTYADSEIFTEEDLRKAVECVRKDFQAFRGCRRYSLSYNGDAKSLREAGYQRKYGRQYDEYIVIDSVFRSPVFGGGTWTGNTIYTWIWILDRNAGGEWTVIDRGWN